MVIIFCLSWFWITKSPCHRTIWPTIKRKICCNSAQNEHKPGNKLVDRLKGHTNLCKPTIVTRHSWKFKQAKWDAQLHWFNINVSIKVNSVLLTMEGLQISKNYFFMYSEGYTLFEKHHQETDWNDIIYTVIFIFT